MNPFTFGNPIKEPTLFIGRKAEIGQIVSRLLSSAHESTSIVGERRIGKTSLLKYLANPDIAESHGLSKENYCLVYMDFQGLTDITPQRFWDRVLHKMARAIDNKEIIAEIKSVREIDSIDLFDLEDLFSIVSDNNINIVLLLDEFEFVTQNPNFGSDFFGGLRALAIHYNLALVSSTRRELVDLCHSDEIKGSPFFNIFATVILRPFSQEETKELLLSYSANAGKPFDDDEIKFLLNMAGCYPLFSQIGGCYLYDGKEKGLASNELFEFVMDSFLTQADQHFTYYWSHSSDSEKITMLTILALGDSKKAKKKQPTEDNIKQLHQRAVQDIAELRKRGLVTENKGLYHIFSPVFSQWIRLEVSAAPGEEETPDTVDEWLKAGGNDKLQPAKNKFPKFKKKYWNTVAIIIKDISIDIIEKVTVEMIMRGI